MPATMETVLLKATLALLCFAHGPADPYDWMGGAMAGYGVLWVLSGFLSCVSYVKGKR